MFVILTDAAESCDIIKKNVSHRRSKKNNQIWFDSDCKNARIQ